MKKLLQGCVIILGPLAIVAAIYLNWSSGFVQPPQPGDTSVKTHIYGIDGATWYLMLPMIQMGRLPALAKLKQHGAYGNLRSEEPTLSPVIWTTIATGMGRDKHGIIDFVSKLPGEYKSTPVTRKLRKVEAIWNIFNHNNRTCGVINWWASWPAEQVDGFVLTNNLFYIPALENEELRSISKGLAYPPSLLDELEGHYTGHQQEAQREVSRILWESVDIEAANMRGGGANAPPPRSEEFMRNLITASVGKFARIEVSLYHIAIELMHKYDPDLMAIYLEGVDAVSHFLWMFMEPKTQRGSFEVKQDQIERYGHAIIEYYSFTDRMISALIENAPRRTNFFIASDHGFEARYDFPRISRIYQLNNLFERLGLLVYDSKGEIDWTNTQLFDLAQSEFWAVTRSLFLNVKGREKHGIIPPSQFENKRREIAARLSALETISGKSVFLSVQLPSQAKPTAGEGRIVGDIVVNMNINLDLDDKLSINGVKYSVSEFILPRRLSGDHHILGVFLAAGSNIVKGRYIPNISIADVTPTMLALAGMPIGADMDGKAVLSIAKNGFLERFPLRYTKTYEKYKKKDDGITTGSIIDEHAKDRLRELGYIK